MCTLFDNFNPRTPDGVRPHETTAEAAETTISIHAPLTGCDDKSKKTYYSLATISIHAPLTGCDGIVAQTAPELGNFNPRTPDGVRRGEMG